MPRKPKAVVLDSWSIIAYLEDEPAGQKVADIIADCHENETPLRMAMINAGEVWYLIARAESEQEADASLAELKNLGIEFVTPDWALTREAARFKARCKMSFSDCFAAALAKEHKADLLTGDQEFKQVEGEIRVSWL